MVDYAKPATLEEALALLTRGPWRVLAGGTDFYPGLGDRPLRENVLDINGLSALRGLSETENHLVFGARTSWTDIVRAELPPAFDALKLAAREVGSIQIQNAGTVAGNLCNASPAADGVPALMTLDAEVVLRSARGTRHLPLSNFILGNRRTARLSDELVTAIRVPRARTAGGSSFVKLGARRYLVISIAMAAARIALDAEGRVADAAVSVGSCSEVAMRLEKLEGEMLGRPAAGLADAVSARHLAGLAPIDDVRGTGGYRRSAALEIVRRAVAGALDAFPKRERAA